MKIKPTDKVYIQNGFVGNSVIWWAKGGGYTTDIEKAEVLTLEEAQKTTKRWIDWFWLKSHVDSVISKHVDGQHLNHTYRLDAEKRDKQCWVFMGKKMGKKEANND